MLTVSGWIGLGIGITVVVTIVVLFTIWYFRREKRGVSRKTSGPVGYDLEWKRKKRQRRSSNILSKTRKVMGIAVKESALAKAFNTLVKNSR